MSFKKFHKNLIPKITPLNKSCFCGKANYRTDIQT